ncbi:MAG: hypothetical protein J0L92_24120 [Deltaproteobacteria bacterium]|nr:hypothetical protein [Deltaproteobacteria bacterium]
MENEQLVQRDIEILQRAQSIGANLDFLLLFAVAGFMALLGVVCIIGMGMWGMILFGALAAAAAIDFFTGIGDKATILSLVVISALFGIGTIAVAVYVWTGAGGAA